MEKEQVSVLSLPSYLFIDTIDNEKLIVNTNKYIISTTEALLQNNYQNVSPELVKEQIYYIVTNQYDKINEFGKILQCEISTIEP